MACIRIHKLEAEPKKKTLAVSFPIKHSSLERGFEGFSALFCNISVQQRVSWILDPSKVCIKRECMDLQVALLFHVCPVSVCEIQTVQELRWARAAAEGIEVLCNMMGVLAGWIFWAEKQESGLCYSLFQLRQKHVSHHRKPEKNFPLGMTEAPAGRGLRQD